MNKLVAIDLKRQSGNSNEASLVEENYCDGDCLVVSNDDPNLMRIRFLIRFVPFICVEIGIGLQHMKLLQGIF